MEKLQVFKIGRDQFDLSNIPDIKSILVIVESKLEANIVDSFYVKLQAIAYALVWSNDSLSVFLADDYVGEYTEDCIAEMLTEDRWRDD